MAKNAFIHYLYTGINYPAGDQLKKILVASVLKNVTDERHTTFDYDQGETVNKLFPCE